MEGGIFIFTRACIKNKAAYSNEKMKPFLYLSDWVLMDAW
jgi:hypothetical protein